jgi:hypothetical protein
MVVFIPTVESFRAEQRIGKMEVVCGVNKTVKGGRFLRQCFLPSANVPRLERKTSP